jgi:hypothetical protein
MRLERRGDHARLPVRTKAAAPIQPPLDDNEANKLALKARG